MVFCMTLSVSHMVVEEVWQFIEVCSISLCTALLRSHHCISVRLRSGLWLDHCNTLILFFFRHSVVDLLLCLSCCACFPSWENGLESAFDPLRQLLDTHLLLIKVLCYLLINDYTARLYNHVYKTSVDSCKVLLGTCGTALFITGEEWLEIDLLETISDHPSAIKTLI